MHPALHRAQEFLSEESFFAEPSVLPSELVYELASLKAPGDQRAMVAIFHKAARCYDDGHRPYEGSTMDVVLDEIFPHYGSTALLSLFKRFSKLSYFTTDGFYRLFAPALAGLNEPGDFDKVIAFIQAVIDTALDRSIPELTEVQDMLARVGPQLSAHRQVLDALEYRVSQAVQEIGQNQLEADVMRQMDAGTLVAVIESRGMELLHSHSNASVFEKAILRNLAGIPMTVMESLASKALAVPRFYDATACLPYLFLRDPKVAPDVVERLATHGREQRKMLIKALTNVLRWVEDEVKQHGQHKPVISEWNDTALLRMQLDDAACKAMKLCLGQLQALDKKTEQQEAAAEMALLASVSAETLANVVAVRGHVLCADHPAAPEFQRAVGRLLAALPLPSLEAMVDQCLARADIHTTERTLPYLFLKDAAFAHQFVLSRGMPPAVHRGTLNSALHGEAEYFNQPERWADEPWMEMCFHNPEAIAAMSQARRALAPAFIDPLERASQRVEA